MYMWQCLGLEKGVVVYDGMCYVVLGMHVGIVNIVVDVGFNLKEFTVHSLISKTLFVDFGDFKNSVCLEWYFQAFSIGTTNMVLLLA